MLRNSSPISESRIDAKTDGFEMSDREHNAQTEMFSKVKGKAAV